jgi:hypothetical protein
LTGLFSIGLADIPPCTDAYFNLGGRPLLDAILLTQLPAFARSPSSLTRGRSGWYWVPDRLYLIDGNGHSWLISATAAGRPFLTRMPARPGCA